jgi:hypothetical protein
LGYTFRDIAARRRDEITRLFGSSSLPARVSWELSAANRTYYADNLRPDEPGNYLEDFLQVHGDEEIVPITCSGGTPHGAGEGVSFVDLPRLRRRVEDALRKTATPHDLCEVAEILGVRIG